MCIGMGLRSLREAAWCVAGRTSRAGPSRSRTERWSTGPLPADRPLTNS